MTHNFGHNELIGVWCEDADKWRKVPLKSRLDTLILVISSSYANIVHYASRDALINAEYNVNEIQIEVRVRAK